MKHLAFKSNNLHKRRTRNVKQIQTQVNYSSLPLTVRKGLFCFIKNSSITGVMILIQDSSTIIKL